MDIQVGVALKGEESYKKITEGLEERANPFDPEAEGDFGNQDFSMLKRFFGDAVKAE